MDFVGLCASPPVQRRYSAAGVPTRLPTEPLAFDDRCVWLRSARGVMFHESTETRDWLLRTLRGLAMTSLRGPSFAEGERIRS